MTDEEGKEALSDAAEHQFETLRERLAERRREMGVSMSELARQIGVSPSLISQIERGQTLPSVATLFALATALGATVDMFFDTRAAQGSPPPVEEPASPVWTPAARQDVPRPPHEMLPVSERTYVVRRHGRAAIDVRGGVRWERLTPVSLQDVEFLELVYQPGAASDESLYRHPGYEMVVVLEGRFVIHVGFDAFELEAGDSIAFPSSLPHRYVNPTENVSRAVTAILRAPVTAAGFAALPAPPRTIPPLQ